MMKKVDICSFINSRDVAAHCREINKAWNPFEMAVIIGRSNRTIAEKHAAWRELIADYPDMPTPQKAHHQSYDSLHEKLTEVMDYQERALEKASTGNMSNIEVDMDHDGNPCSLFIHDRAELFPDIDFDNMLDDLGEVFYVNIPVPFKRGDILTVGYDLRHQARDNYVFVLKSLDRDNQEKLTQCLSMDWIYITEGWGFFVDDYGALYGNHIESYDGFEYYRGKLEGKERLLHYVNLFLKDKIGLPELLAVQCRIILEHQLKNTLCIHMHGRHIPEHLLAENRLTHEEKEKIAQTNGLMPWVAKKLSICQVEFLVKEFGYTLEETQIELSDGGGWFMGMCAGIVHKENYYAKTNDSRFNYDRRAMAKLILESYGHTEDRWIDKYAEIDDDWQIDHERNAEGD